MTREFWRELLEAWLKSMGLENLDTRCSYKGRSYRPVKYAFAIGNFGGRPLHIDIKHFNDDWAQINLEVENVDPLNPSFDPDEFFAPFKKWMDEN